MTGRVLLYAAICSCFFLFCYHFEIRYQYSDLKGYTDALLNASSMIFTLMGIWIAFLYPNALSRLANPTKVAVADFTESLDETRRLESIVSAVLKSGLVVIGVLAISLLKLLFGSLEFVISNMSEFKAAALALITSLSILQAEAIVGVIYANVMFLEDLHSKREDRELDDDV